MYNMDVIEESYRKYTKDLNYWLPEGANRVNLQFLNQFDLLHFQPIRSQKEPLLNTSFQMIESPEKITLINEEFVVWIIPQHHPDPTETNILIALNGRTRSLKSKQPLSHQGSIIPLHWCLAC